MSKKGNELLKALRTSDQICKLLTGKKLSTVMANAMELFGQDVIEKVSDNHKPEIDFNNPYYILGVHADSPDFVIKATFRSWARELHPDTGTKPDPVKFAKISEAYNQIMASRKSNSI